MAELSVIVPVKNQFDLFDVCYNTLDLYTACDLVVIDDGSSQGDLRDGYPDDEVKIVRNEKSVGWCKAINQGLELIDQNSDYVCFCNSDIAFTPHWFSEVKDAFDWDDLIGIVGPTTNRVTNRQNIDYNTATSERFELTTSLIFFCVVVCRELVEKIGGLDERFGLGGQDDVDYCIRAQEAGYRVAIARDSFVYHYGSATFREEFSHNKQKSKEYAASRQKILEEKYPHRFHKSKETLMPSKVIFPEDYESQDIPPDGSIPGPRKSEPVKPDPIPEELVDEMVTRVSDNLESDGEVVVDNQKSSPDSSESKENVKQKRTIFVGVPNYTGSVRGGLMDLLFLWGRVYDHDRHPEYYMLPPARRENLQPLNNARAHLIKEFLDGNADYLLWVDDDIIPPPNALEVMANHLDTKPEISAIGAAAFSMKSQDDMYFPYPVTLKYNDEKKYNVYYGNGLEEVDATGGACVMFRREVYETIQRPYRYHYYPDGTLNLTCDFDVWQQCQSHGFRLFIDFNLICDHQRMCSIKGFQDTLAQLQRQHREEVAQLKSMINQLQAK